MSNLAKLTQFVAAALATAPTTADPADYLRRSASKINGMILALDRPGPVPAQLVGVSAFDLADARDRLSGAALKCAVPA
jgi:hypothetical protein